jgi:hypothetical protein
VAYAGLRISTSMVPPLGQAKKGKKWGQSDGDAIVFSGVFSPFSRLRSFFPAPSQADLCPVCCAMNVPLASTTKRLKGKLLEPCMNAGQILMLTHKS